MTTPRFHSQCGEDRWIIENLKPEPGHFIEVGAYDGWQSSNTIAFEDLGWHGICVEPDPIMAAQCMASRKCQTVCAAVGDTLINPIAFFVNEQDRGLSCLRWKPTCSEKSIMVPVLTLKSLILSMPLFQCDLLSIDTEGTELEVWESGAGYRPRIVIMEYQTCSEPSQEVPITERMTKDGYRVAHKTQYNLIFTRD